MSALVWKLLRQHISIGQLAGFFLANLFGMMMSPCILNAGPFPLPKTSPT